MLIFLFIYICVFSSIMVLDIIIKLSYNTVLQDLIPQLKEIKNILEKREIDDLVLSYPYFKF